MMHSRTALLVLASLVLAVPALADDSGSFLYRLGQDTTSVEHYTRGAAKLELDQVGRAPRAMRRHYAYDLENGSVRHVTIVATPPGAPTPMQSIDATFGPDSMRMTVNGANGATQHLALVVPAGAIVIPGGSPWPVYEMATMKLAQGKADSLAAPLYFLGAQSMNHVTFRKLGRDSVDVYNDHMDRYHVHIDKAGHVLGVLPVAGTQKFGTERLASVDLDAYAASFAAREKAGEGMGMLSPRDSVKVVAGGASIYVDYGRPAKRGRTVWGGILIPYGEVWRTGANAATQFRTDKPLDFGGGVVVPAGFYTLWTLATKDGVHLIVNGETGQWGTEHKAAKDLYTIPMQVTALPDAVERFTIGVDPSAEGGTIRLDWDTTRASAAFTVKS